MHHLPRQFCEKVGFTHVGTVSNNGLIIEERGLEDKDWTIYDLASTDDFSESGTNGDMLSVELTAEEKVEQDKKRKLAFNAPKRIEKIEEMIEKSEMKIAEYDRKMLQIGNDVEQLMQMTEMKTNEEERVANLMEEWESLEEVMAEMIS